MVTSLGRNQQVCVKMKFFCSKSVTYSYIVIFIGMKIREKCITLQYAFRGIQQ